MGNMSYCRMENTARDLYDCLENWEDVSSESEREAQKRILEYAEKIVKRHSERYILADAYSNME